MNVGLHFRVIIYSFAVSVQRVSLNHAFCCYGRGHLILDEWNHKIGYIVGLMMKQQKY